MTVVECDRCKKQQRDEMTVLELPNELLLKTGKQRLDLCASCVRDLHEFLRTAPAMPARAGA